MIGRMAGRPETLAELQEEGGSALISEKPAMIPGRTGLTEGVDFPFLTCLENAIEPENKSIGETGGVGRIGAKLNSAQCRGAYSRESGRGLANNWTTASCFSDNRPLGSGGYSSGVGLLDNGGSSQLRGPEVSSAASAQAGCEPTSAS